MSESLDLDNRVIAALRLQGESVSVAAEDIVWGSPATQTVPLLVTAGASEVGVWTMERGAYRDVEIDEVFVVLAGRALLTINDLPPREISTGDVVRLYAGDKTTWAVQTSLRKLYVAALSNSPTNSSMRELNV